MNQLSEQKHTPQSVLGTIQMLVPSSFEKKFSQSNMQTLVTAMSICLDGLSQEQIFNGIRQVMDMGFCPDPALFRRWCLGLKGFDSSDAIADSYIGKTGALAGIIRWIADSSNTQITVAQKQAYDQTHHMFDEIPFADNQDIATSKAHRAYMDTYENIVFQLVSQKQPCETYVPPPSLDYKPTPKQAEQGETISDERAREIFAQLQGKMKGINKMDMVA